MYVCMQSSMHDGIHVFVCIYVSLHTTDMYVYVFMYICWKICMNLYYLDIHACTADLKANSFCCLDIGISAYLKHSV